MSTALGIREHSPEPGAQVTQLSPEHQPGAKAQAPSYLAAELLPPCRLPVLARAGASGGASLLSGMLATLAAVSCWAVRHLLGRELDSLCRVALGGHRAGTGGRARAQWPGGPTSSLFLVVSYSGLKLSLSPGLFQLSQPRRISMKPVFFLMQICSVLPGPQKTLLGHQGRCPPPGPCLGPGADSP